MRKVNNLALVILLLSVSAFSQATGSVSGTITFAADKSPLHGAAVRIIGSNRTAITDDDGRFSIAGLPPGKYTLLVHQEGFSDITRQITVIAEQDTKSDFELSLGGIREQVTVTASGLEQSTFEAIASVTTVDSSQITSRAAVGIGDVLNNEPGIAKRSLGPGNSRPVIRGFDGDRVLIATDGVRVGSLGSQSGDHSEPVDIFAAERIEVVKGPATLLYGSNAIGGVVNAISGHDEGAHPGLRGRFSIIGGANSNQAAAGGGLEYGVGRWMLWADASGQRTGDYGAGRDFGKVVNSFTRSAAGSFGGGYFADKGFVNSTFSYYQNRYGIPLDFHEPEPVHRTLAVRRFDYKINAGFRDLKSFIEGARFTLDFSNYRHRELVDDVVGTTFRNKVFSYRGMFDQKKYGVLTGRFGFEGYRRDYTTFGGETLVRGPVKQDSFSVFGLQEVNLERVTLQFGARIENNRYRPENPALPERDFTGFSGAAGVRVGLWKNGAFAANYSRAYRAPALEELYNFGPHDGTVSFEIGNPNLRAETSNGIDLSLRQQSGRLKAEANYYYYRMKNFVFLAPIGLDDEESGLPIAKFLQGNSRFAGVELNLDYAATNWLNLLTSFDYVNAELADGRPLPRIPPMRARFGFDAHYRNFSLRPEFIAVGRQDRVFTNETATAGFGIFNIGGTYVIPGKHTAHIFSVNAFNLGNRLYFNHVSFIKDIAPEIGRGMRVTYTIRFF